jgi:probable phosphoglycerate mutase
MDASPTRAQRRALQGRQRADKTAARMARPCTLILARHGETDWNMQRRLQGAAAPGPPLNARGCTQALALAAHIAAGPQIDAVYSSDLSRARETAAAVAAALPCAPAVREKPELRERALGAAEGRTLAELRAEDAAAYAAVVSRDEDAPPPGGGESVAALRARVGAALEAIAAEHPGGRVLIVTHGGVLRAAATRAGGVAAAAGPAANCSCGTLLIDAAARPALWAATAWGDAAHLGAGAAAGTFGGGFLG